jgi:transcriptional regulator with XRE-family HTH domain
MAEEGQNPIQIAIAGLQTKGWTLASIADAVGMSRDTLETWRNGKHRPANERLALSALETLGKRKRAPKRRRAKPKADES